jgi:ElaB/YqjD/DUF883 family membrane-anchored ribosome-binding protein
MNETVERFKEQAAQMQSVYEDGRRTLSGFKEAASEKSRKLFEHTDEWVHENPWTMLGIVAGASVLLGLILAQIRHH